MLKEQVGSQCPCPEACHAKSLFHYQEYKTNFSTPKTWIWINFMGKFRKAEEHAEKNSFFHLKEMLSFFFSQTSGCWSQIKAQWRQ